MKKIGNTRRINGRDVFSVPFLEIIENQTSIHPNMQHDAKIVVNAAMPNNPLTRPGLRFGNWPAESEKE